MSKALKFIKADRIAWDGIELVHYASGNIYLVPDEFVPSFLQRGSAVEVSIKIESNEKGCLVGTPVAIKEQPVVPIIPQKSRSLLKRIFSSKK